MDDTDARNEYAAVRARLRDLVSECGLSRTEAKLFDEALIDLDVAVIDIEKSNRAPVPRQVWYMAHPVGGDVTGNLERADRWLTFLRRGFPDIAVIAPWIASIKAGENDADPEQRERGLLDAVAVCGRCDAIVLTGGRVSAGMEREARAARNAGATVMDMTWLGVEPPVDGDVPDSWSEAISRVRAAGAEIGTAADVRQFFREMAEEAEGV